MGGHTVHMANGHGDGWGGLVLESLIGLPIMQRRAVRLAYFHRCTRSEIAETMQITPAEVGRLVAAGLQTMAVSLTSRFQVRATTS